MAAPLFADFSAAAGWEAALAYVFIRVLPIWAFGALVGMLVRVVFVVCVGARSNGCARGLSAAPPLCSPDPRR